MILYDFRYQDPWAEENITLPDFVQQSQARQRLEWRASEGFRAISRRSRPW